MAYHREDSGMIKRLKIHNWDQWQSFRGDRGTPPWIKIHRKLMTDMKWMTLTDAEKGQVVSIWIIAADQDGYIPNNPVLIRKMAGLDENPNIEKFIEIGMLDVCQPDDNQMTTKCQPNDRPETETETETETEKEKPTRSRAGVFRADVFLAEFCSDKQLIKDWLQVRKTKRLAATETAMKRFVAKVEASGRPIEEILTICCDRGWGGFEVGWLDKRTDQQGVSQMAKGLAVFDEIRRRNNEVGYRRSDCRTGEVISIETRQNASR